MARKSLHLWQYLEPLVAQKGKKAFTQHYNLLYCPLKLNLMLLWGYGTSYLDADTEPIKVGKGFPIEIISGLLNTWKNPSRGIWDWSETSFSPKTQIVVFYFFGLTYSDICFQLHWCLTALPGVALLHGSCSLGPIWCPGFGSLQNSFSPLAGLVGRYTRAIWCNA